MFSEFVATPMYNTLTYVELLPAISHGTCALIRSACTYISGAAISSKNPCKTRRAKTKHDAPATAAWLRS